MDWERLRLANAALLRAYMLRQVMPEGPELRKLFLKQVRLLGRSKELTELRDVMFELKRLRDISKKIKSAHPQVLEDEQFLRYEAAMLDISFICLAKVIKS